MRTDGSALEFQSSSFWPQSSLQPSAIHGVQRASPKVKDKLDLIGKGTILTDLIRVPGSDIGGWKELPQRKNKQSHERRKQKAALIY
jgi:hypothetical protein